MQTDTLIIGRHYFIGETRRTDAFAHKRYTNPEVETFEHRILMGKLVEIRGGQIKLQLTRNNLPEDGNNIVTTPGSLIVADGDFRTKEQHGSDNDPFGRQDQPTLLGVWKSTKKEVEPTTKVELDINQAQIRMLRTSLENSCIKFLPTPIPQKGVKPSLWVTPAISADQKYLLDLYADLLDKLPTA